MLVKYEEYITKGRDRGKVRTMYCLLGFIPLFIKYSYDN